jgi:hypothetical protein
VVRDRAHELLAREAGTAANLDVPAATDRVCRMLHAQLAPVIGSAGYDVLLARALTLARAEFACLSAVRACPGGVLEGLTDMPPGTDRRDRDEALVLVVANVGWLLVTFIGEDATTHLIGKVWPMGGRDDVSRPEGQP